jgi:hypothetical protein
MSIDTNFMIFQYNKINTVIKKIQVEIDKLLKLVLRIFDVNRIF